MGDLEEMPDIEELERLSEFYLEQEEKRR